MLVYDERDYEAAEARFHSAKVKPRSHLMALSLTASIIFALGVIAFVVWW